MCIPIPSELRNAPFSEKVAYRRQVRQQRRSGRRGAPADIASAQEAAAGDMSEEQQQARELLIRQEAQRRGFGMALRPVGNAISVGVRTLMGAAR